MHRRHRPHHHHHHAAAGLHIHYPVHLLITLGALVVVVLVVRLVIGNPRSARYRVKILRWRIRLLFYPAAMGISFFSLGEAIPLLGTPGVDHMLLGWDRALLGETPAIAWEPSVEPLSATTTSPRTPAS